MNSMRAKQNKNACMCSVRTCANKLIFIHEFYRQFITEMLREHTIIRFCTKFWLNSFGQGCRDSMLSDLLNSVGFCDLFVGKSKDVLINGNTCGIYFVFH